MISLTKETLPSNLFAKEVKLNGLKNQGTGVFRGRKNRDKWIENWKTQMMKPIKAINASCESFINVTIDKLDEIKIKKTSPSHTQKGGPT